MSQIEVPKAATIGVVVAIVALLIGGLWWRTSVHHADGIDNSRVIAQETADQVRNPPTNSGPVRGRPEPGAPQ